MAATTPSGAYPRKGQDRHRQVGHTRRVSGRGALGAFLTVRRAQLSPEDVGLPRYGERRRVPGLRREEVAQLAGVGMSYYTRLEQGQSRGASPQVLDAIARALGLDAAEHEHLRALAAPPRRQPARRRPAPERVTPETAQLLTALGDAPAIVLGRRSDVLAWNTAGHALYAGHVPQDAPRDPGTRPNMARMVFLDPHTRDLYCDWGTKARAVVGHLRLLVGRHPDDPLLAGLVGELAIRDADFAALWADHRVRDCDVAFHAMRHPLVGELTVAQQTLPVPLDADQRLVVATAGAGTPAADSLALLARAAPHPARPALRPTSAEPALLEQ